MNYHNPENIPQEKIDEYAKQGWRRFREDEDPRDKKYKRHLRFEVNGRLVLVPPFFVEDITYFTDLPEPEEITEPEKAPASDGYTYLETDTEAGREIVKALIEAKSSRLEISLIPGQWTKPIWSISAKEYIGWYRFRLAPVSQQPISQDVCHHGCTIDFYHPSKGLIEIKCLKCGEKLWEKNSEIVKETCGCGVMGCGKCTDEMDAELAADKPKLDLSNTLATLKANEGCLYHVVNLIIHALKKIQDHINQTK